MAYAEDHIAAELGSLHDRKYARGNDLMLRCPFHAGDDNPSLGVNLSMSNGKGLRPGTFYCFGCGEKGGWNKLAAKLGLRPLDEEDFDDKKGGSAILDDYGSGLERSLAEPQDPMPNPASSTPFPWEKWRGVSGSTVRRAGGVVAMDWMESKPALWLPVSVDGEVEMAVKARLEAKKGKPSYLFHDVRKIKRKPLYGFDLADSMLSNRNIPRAVFVVEGSRDALRLADAGLAAVALLSSTGWNERKKHQILDLRQRRDAFPVVMMDSDPAGRKAQKQVVKDMKSTEPKIKQVDLALHAGKLGLKSLDPADLDDAFLKRVKKTLARMG